MLATPTAITLHLTPAEREQLLVALEFALAILRGHGEGLRLALDLDARAVDALADRVVMLACPFAERRAHEAAIAYITRDQG